MTIALTRCGCVYNLDTGKCVSVDYCVDKWLLLQYPVHLETHYENLERQMMQNFGSVLPEAVKNSGVLLIEVPTST